ncbi:Integrase catalytic domain-containing protein [Aphis craccivora]|uniref:Integrase catalytic domain-containing protein n=1 Tax=Aphis craccivora TaxID=307492 RepID=A0A6G0VTS2_APHCR|nr:Integrase catalytic domain-containing protein [Aphis craccivora]
MQPHSRQNNDTFTKYVWVEALKNKTAKECTKGIIKILKKNQPKLLQTDNRTEFYNNTFQSIMKKYHIKHYSTYSSIKAGSWNWINSIFKLVYNYNNTKHSIIKCSPHETRINPVTIKRKTLQINTSNKLFKIKN